MALPVPEQVVSHYSIVGRLGGGGMGVVYEALDLRLERSVALKFLPFGSSADRVSKRRFVREAQAASAIDHPNICTIYEIGETETEGLFIAMAYYAGETLKKRVGRGALPPVQALDYLAQALSGLDKAHSHGILHRDLKPANLMITDDGLLKILDFGLAKLIGSSRITGLHQTPGTVYYMSPEQTRGEPVDARSDLWSLGVVLYELVTGRLPFPGPVEASLVAIRQEPPAPVSTADSDVSLVLEKIVTRALAKRPEERFQSAAEMLAALRQVEQSIDRSGSPRVDTAATTLASPTLPSPEVRTRWRRAAAALLVAGVIAVWLVVAPPWRGPPTSPAPVPGDRLRVAVLQPETPDEGVTREWSRLAQGLLGEELTGREGIGVLDPLSLNGLLQSVLGSPRPPRDDALYQKLLAADLDYVIDGALVGGAEGYRVVISMVEPQTRESVFTHTVAFSSESELPAALSKASSRLAEFLQLEILGLSRDADLQPWASLRRHDPDAVKAFLQAKEYIYRREPGGQKYLREAVEIDPGFVAPRIWLISGLKGEGKAEEARRQFDQLLAYEDRATPFERAMIDWAGAYLEDDFVEQARHIEMALHFSPDNHILVNALGFIRYVLGDCAATLETIAPAIEAKWSYGPLYALSASCLVAGGEFARAREQLAASLEFATPLPSTFVLLEGLSVEQDEPEAAAAYRERRENRFPEEPEPKDPVVASALHRLAASCLSENRFACSESILRRAVVTDPQPAAHEELLGEVLLRQGKLDRATAWIERSLASDPARSRPHLLLAEIAEKRGEDPRRHYRRFLEAAPEDPRAEEVESWLQKLENQADTGPPYRKESR